MVITFDMNTSEVEYEDGFTNDTATRPVVDGPSRDEVNAPRLELGLMTVTEAIAAERRRR